VIPGLEKKRFVEKDRVSVHQISDEALNDLIERKQASIRGARVILFEDKSVLKEKPANAIVSPYVKLPGRRFEP